MPAPQAPRGGDYDDYHGVRVDDPYRWLEDPRSPQTLAWVAEQQRSCESWLAATPARKQIEQRLRALWDRPRRGLPVMAGDRWFWTENPGLLPHECLYMASSIDGSATLLFDPNELSDDGRVAPADFVVSPNARYLAYALSTAGSDWIEWRVRGVDGGRQFEDRLRGAKWGGCAWSGDDAGFFYAAYDPEDDLASTTEHKLYYHRLGATQAEDRLIFAPPPGAGWVLSPSVTLDGRYLVIEVEHDADPFNLVLIRELAGGSVDESAPLWPLVDRFAARYRLLGNEGARLVLFTTDQAPHGRVVSVDIDDPTAPRWRELIAERERPLEHAVLTRDHLLALYLDDCKSAVEVFERNGHPCGPLTLPTLGSVVDLSARQDQAHCLLAFESFTRPRTSYRVDFEHRRCDPLGAESGELADYLTRQVFYTSKDGTRIPMFLIHRPGLELDGSHPTYLYGYGGFGACETPQLREDVLVFLDMGGVFALPNIRGGGEYGEAWHAAGTVHGKQRVFDDFIAAAQWLIGQGYTSPPRLAIGGGSNGGLLVAACMLQRPELFGAVVCMVGVLDMLRYQHWTIGWAWRGEYGCSDDLEQFRSLLAYSPVHRVDERVVYPPILLTTGDHDDRVVPAHSYKFAATLQAAAQAREQPSPPILLRIESRAGHGAGKPSEAIIAEQRDRLSFLLATIGAARMDPR